MKRDMDAGVVLVWVAWGLQVSVRVCLVAGLLGFS